MLSVSLRFLRSQNEKVDLAAISVIRISNTVTWHTSKSMQLKKHLTIFKKNGGFLRQRMLL